METTRGHEPADPEFDDWRGATPRLRDFDPAEHQRLVINPFLAVLGLIGLARLARWLLLAERLDRATFPVLLTLALPLMLLPWLIQYHCIDCGRTGAYPRHARHACAGVKARWLDGARSSRWLPTPWAQVVAWGWVLGAVGLLVVILAWT